MSRYDPAPMQRIERTIDVAAPIDVVWAEATQFEALAEWVPALREVRPVAADRLRRIADTAGVERAGEVVVSGRRPARQIAWHGTDGPQHEGRIVSSAPDDRTTRLDVALDVGGRDGVDVATQLESALARSKEALETGPPET